MSRYRTSAGRPVSGSRIWNSALPGAGPDHLPDPLRDQGRLPLTIGDPPDVDPFVGIGAILTFRFIEDVQFHGRAGKGSQGPREKRGGPSRRSRDRRTVRS